MGKALEIGTKFMYRDVDHEGASYALNDALSGLYEVVDASQYPRYVKVKLLMWESAPHDGTGAILNWDEQEANGYVKRIG